MLGGLDDGDGPGSPEVMSFALDALRIQLIVLGVELKLYIAFFFIGYHEIQVLAKSAADESGLTRIESQHVHWAAAQWMRDFLRQLPYLPGR
jgi:hypothetical protein